MNGRTVLLVAGFVVSALAILSVPTLAQTDAPDPAGETPPGPPRPSLVPT